MSRWRKYWALPRQTRRRLIYAGLLQGLTRLLLAVLPFKTFKKVYGRWGGAKGGGAEEWVYAVSTAGNVLKTTCLVQALVLRHLVSDSRLVIGVMGGQSFEAHAWVEKEGKVILGEAPRTQYSPIWVWD